MVLCFKEDTIINVRYRETKGYMMSDDVLEYTWPEDWIIPNYPPTIHGEDGWWQRVWHVEFESSIDLSRFDDVIAEQVHESLLMGFERIGAFEYLFITRSLLNPNHNDVLFKIFKVLAEIVLSGALMLQQQSCDVWINNSFLRYHPAFYVDRASSSVDGG